MSVAATNTIASAPEADASALRQHQTGRLNLVFAAWMLAFHLAGIAALFFFRWSSLVAFAATWVLAQNIGIGMSYHRQLTHRGYHTPRWLEYAMAICATLALEGGPLFWVSVHRLHHQITDRPGDPHSPRDGAWWSHMGWMLWGTLHNHDPLLTRYTPDLYKQPFYVWLSRLHWVPLTLLGIAPGLVRRRCRSPGPQLGSVGHLPACLARLACHLAGQLGHAHVGLAPL